MSDKPTIIVGLVIGLGVLTVPFWYSLAAGTGSPPPQLELPEGQCVQENMAAHHMEVLNRWRNEVVRHPECPHQIEVNGKVYPKSLTKGCLGCHTSNERFCARCHNYANVEPTCWDCHVDSFEN